MSAVARNLTFMLVVASLLMISAMPQSSSRQRGDDSSWNRLINDMQGEVSHNSRRIERLEARAAQNDPTYLDSTITNKGVADSCGAW